MSNQGLDLDSYHSEDKNYETSLFPSDSRLAREETISRSPTSIVQPVSLHNLHYHSRQVLAVHSAVFLYLEGECSLA